VAPASLVARVHGEFSEMPGLRLTLEQACRLRQLEVSVCETLLGHLVREGFVPIVLLWIGAFVRDRSIFF